MVLRLSPHRLQLGFLKLLKGSGLRSAANKYQYKFTSYPPYEVLSNHVLSFPELVRLKQIEELVELYYNSHRFDRSMEYLFRQMEGDAFYIFDQMTGFWKDKGYFNISHSNISLYEHLLDFAATLTYVDTDLFGQLLLFDYLLHGKPGRYPAGLKPFQDEGFRRSYHDFLREEKNLDRLLPEWKGHTPGQIIEGSCRGFPLSIGFTGT